MIKFLVLLLFGFIVSFFLVSKIVDLCDDMPGEEVLVPSLCFPVLLILLGGPLWGLFDAMNAEIDRKKAERLLEYRAIAENPGEWLSRTLKTVSDPSVGGVILVIDRKIGEIERQAQNVKDMDKMMEYGRAIDVLEERKECVRRLKKPVKCAGLPS